MIVLPTFAGRYQQYTYLYSADSISKEMDTLVDKYTRLKKNLIYLFNKRCYEKNFFPYIFFFCSLIDPLVGALQTPDLFPYICIFCSLVDPFYSFCRVIVNTCFLHTFYFL